MSLELPDREETYCPGCGNAPGEGETCPLCGRRTPEPMIITYELRLTIVRAVKPWDFDTTVQFQETAAWMEGKEAKRELEREVLRALRVLDGDCDCEVMDTVKTEEN